MLAICLNNQKARHNFNRTYLEVVSLWYTYGFVKALLLVMLSDFDKLISFAMMSSSKFYPNKFKSSMPSLHCLIWASDRGVNSLVRRPYATVIGVRCLKTNEYNQGPRLKNILCSTQLIMLFILLINVKIHKIVG